MYYLVIVTISDGRTEKAFPDFESCWNASLNALLTIPEGEAPQVSIGKRDGLVIEGNRGEDDSLLDRLAD